MIKYNEVFNNILIPILMFYKNKNGIGQVYKYFFEILYETKKEFQKKYNDTNGQKWRNQSGKLLEQLVLFFIAKHVEKLGYSITTDDELKNANNGILEQVAHNIAIKYGPYFVMPDGDIVIYSPKTTEIKAIISCKASTRERYTQTLYWKLKLSLIKRTGDIKVYFVTVDKEWNKNKSKIKKPQLDIIKGKKPTKTRILLEYEMDGIYVGRELKGGSEKVKEFREFVGDIKKILR